jgi:glycosyltransferase involved in cell wall biosynthesis
MRIAYVSNSVLPSSQANSVQVMRMADAFSQHGHDVTLFARRGEPGTDLHSHYGTSGQFRIVLSAIPGVRLLRSTWYAAIVRRRLRAEAVDLVYGRDPRLLLSLARAGHRVVYEAHAPPQSARRLRIERALTRRPELLRVVVISDALRRMYERSFPKVRRCRFLVAHDAATVPDADPTEAAGEGAVVRVGYVGSPYPGRGIDLIVELATELPDIEFHILGGTTAEVAAHADEPLPSNLTVHGYVAPSALPDHYANLDVLLAPYQTQVAVAGGTGIDSSSWMSPLKIFEYLAQGKPVVSSDLPVLREVLNEEVAILCRPDDRDQWAQAICRLTADPHLREQLGSAGREHVAAHYSWSARAKQVIADLPI